MKKIFFALLAFFALNMVLAQNFNSQNAGIARQACKINGEVVFSFTVSDKDIINNDLTHIISIDHVKSLPGGQGYAVRAYANEEQFIEFLGRNIPYEIIPKNIPKALTMATTVAQMANWDRYPTYAVYEQMMAAFASNYPALCDIDTIMSPTPSGNYRILVAKISDNVNTAENEPQFLYTSTMHGDETTGYILMLRLIDYLLSNYGTLSKVTNLVNNAEIWINPLANPDGTFYNSNPVGSTIANSRRYNNNGKDLNRNYIDPRIGDPNNQSDPAYKPIQPETYAFMDFATAHHFNMSANFHGGAELMNYPWDTWTTSGNTNADRLWWERVCTAYVDTCRLVNASYMSSTYADGVSEGGDWYVITGGRQDYMNFFHHCREVTIELDDTKTTAVENLNAQWNQNYRSLLNYIQESLYGLRGVITDSCTGQPIRAKVWANGYDQTNDSSQVYSALPVGNYHKYMIAGTYNVTFSAPGYISKTYSNLVLNNGAATIQNVVLAPDLPDAQFTGEVTDACAGIATFTNTSTGTTNFTWYFGDGGTSTQQNPVHTYTANGTYNVKLIVTNCKGTDSLVRSNYITINMADAPVATDGSRCGTGTVDLSAAASGNVRWYDAISGGSLIWSGNNYTTPSISNTTTYYAANVITSPVDTAGKTLVLSGGAGTSSGEHYLTFDAYTDFTLISVKVNNTSSSAITRTIELRNSSNSVINGHSISVSIPASTQVIPLNFSVPAGSNHRLVCTSGSNLYRHNSGVSYPYTTTGLLSITSSDAGTDYYYYFYEWLVQEPPCVSQRVPVVATVNALPVSSFTFNVNSNQVSFNNTSTGSVSYYWDFGDGNTSSQPSPVHTYATTGSFNVMLVAESALCGSDTSYQQVMIMVVGENDLEILFDASLMPNPVSDELLLRFNHPLNENFSIEIYNLNGSKVFSKNYTGSESNIGIDVSAFSAGVYTLLMRTEGLRGTHRFLKTE